VELSATSREANAGYWDGAPVPERAITAGMSIILASRQVLVMATGTHKASVVAALLASRPAPGLPASFLLEHPDAQLIVDRAAAPTAS